MSKLATSCVCCGETSLKKAPAVLMPFITHRIFGYSPVEILDDWDLERYGIRKGMAYVVCNSLMCNKCNHLFLDIRFDEEEMKNLYSEYRSDEYVNLRDMYEPGYKLKNSSLEMGYNYVSEIENFLKAYVDISKSFNILDWGGDTGKNTPFHLESEAIYVYDISQKPTIGKARRIKKQQLDKNSYDLVVCSNVLEHVPFPKNTLYEIASIMSNNTVLYIELPYENLVRVFEEENNIENLYKNKRHWHEHINFFTEKSIEKMLYNSGFDILELKKLKISRETSEYVFQVACKKQKKQLG